MTVFRLVPAAAAALLAVAASAAAQTPAPLSLGDTVRRAVEHAPLVAEARARQSAAEATTRAREALTKPTITAMSSYLRTNHVEEFGFPTLTGGTRIVYPDIPSNYRVRAEFGLPIYTGGRTGSLVDAAAAEVRAVDAERRGIEFDIRFEATRAYWLLVTSRESVRVLEQALERADASLRDVGVRVDAGVLPPNEVASARAQRARQAVRLIEARYAATIAEADLARLLGDPPGSRYEPTSPLDQPTPGITDLEPRTLDALVAQARELRPERASLQERQAALLATSDAAHAGSKPQVNALAAVEPASPNPRFFPRMSDWRTSWDVAVQFTWTLWDGGRSDAEAASARAQAEAVSHRVRQFDDAVALDVQQRLGEITSSRAALEAAGEGVAAAVEAHRVVLERFDAGVATPQEVLDAQVARLEAELERTRLTATLRLGEARLLRSLGVTK
jgi:outer membrane protein